MFCVCENCEFKQQLNRSTSLHVHVDTAWRMSENPQKLFQYVLTWFTIDCSPEYFPKQCYSHVVFHSIIPTLKNTEHSCLVHVTLPPSVHHARVSCKYGDRRICECPPMMLWHVGRYADTEVLALVANQNLLKSS